MTQSAPASLSPQRSTGARQILGATWLTTSLLTRPRLDDEKIVLRRVRTVWFLLFFNIVGASNSPVLDIPHKFSQVLTQGSLVAAVILALTINPGVRVRPNLYLGVFTLLGVTTMMSSVRFVGLGTDYRAFRLLAFVGVLWLLTPWWGRRDLVLLRAQVGCLVIALSSVVFGLFVAPHAALANGGRLGGAIWYIAATQVADYSALLTGLCILLFACRLMKRRTAVLIALPSFGVLILTHTRTALVGLAFGGLVALASLLTTRRRVRRAFAAFVLTVALVGVPLAPLIVTWLARGESSAQITSLTGRTNFWAFVFAEQRTTTQKIIGDGIGNGAVHGQSFSGDINAAYANGNPIDSSWVADYQDQGIVGDVLTGLMFVVLLVMGAFAPRGPRRAIALFLVLYCLVLSFTEDGAGIASGYALNMTVAASLVVPEVRRRATRWRHGCERAQFKVLRQ